MENIYHYASVSVALEKLKKEGYTYDFNHNFEEISLHPEDFIVSQMYQYEGNSSPDDSALVYAIVSKFGLKGVFVTGNSANSIDENAQFISKLDVKSKNNSHL
jgi:hypothetical protein